MVKWALTLIIMKSRSYFYSKTMSKGMATQAMARNVRKKVKSERKVAWPKDKIHTV